MKAVVLEIKDGYAAVLSEDGQFIKIKNDNYAPGMELTLEDKNTEKHEAGKKNKNTGKEKNTGKVISLGNRRMRQSLAAVAAALLVVVGIKDFNTPYGTISLDVNPSIEISINRYDRVLSIDAVNDDASEIVEELNSNGLKYKSVDDAVDMALSSLSEGDYAAEDDKTYVMVSANSKSKKHSGRVAEDLKKRCSKHEDISAQVIAADDELVERAEKLDTTAGKLYLVESLRDVSEEDNFDEKDWLKKPVKDIMHEIESKEKPAGKESVEPSQSTQEVPDKPNQESEEVPDKPNQESEEVPDKPDQKPDEKPQSAPEKQL